MSHKRFLSVTEQTIETLREGLFTERWKDTLPGRDQLVKSLGVSARTVEAAVQSLIKEGLLVPQGPGRKKRIVLPDNQDNRPRQFRFTILCRTLAQRRHHITLNLLVKLLENGIDVSFADKSQHGLNYCPKRIVRYMQDRPCQGWILGNAPRPILEACLSNEIPMAAFGGDFQNLPVMGVRPDGMSAIKACVQRLVELGHRRIVMLSPPAVATGDANVIPVTFLETLETNGITTGKYHLPDWEMSPDGLKAILAELFATSPPTAILTRFAGLGTAVTLHLARNGILSPEEVSIVEIDQLGPFSSVVIPKISHFKMDESKIHQPIVRWARKLSNFQDELQQIIVPAEFIEAETIGPPGPNSDVLRQLK